MNQLVAGKRLAHRHSRRSVGLVVSCIGPRTGYGQRGAEPGLPEVTEKLFSFLAGNEVIASLPLIPATLALHRAIHDLGLPTAALIAGLRKAFRTLVCGTHARCTELVPPVETPWSKRRS